MKKCNYQHEATSLEGFVQQLAVGYVARGYLYYVSGYVPRRLTPHQHDRRMLDKFDVARSKWSRYRRRKRRGPDGRPLANCQYIRYREFWVLLCEAGYHEFFDTHSKQDRFGNVTEKLFFDVREVAIQYGGYSIGYANERLSVRLTGKAYKELKSYYLSLARGPLEALQWELRHFPYASWGGVLKQTFAILKSVNVLRKAASVPVVSNSCVQTKRRAVKPFELPKELRRRQEMERQWPLAA